MIFGRIAFENSNINSEEVFDLLKKDRNKWDENEIEKFVQFWSSRIWLTIDGMDERINSVFTNVLIADNPSKETIKKSLKTKSPRWNNKDINRIAKIVKENIIRGKKVHNIINHHIDFQKKLTKIGPVYTFWRHYLVNPKSYPPIDKFNHAAFKFITSSEIYNHVPNNFTYFPIEDGETDYQFFRNWFLGILKSWKKKYNEIDVVNLDKSLMSLGAFILKNSERGEI